MADGRLPKDTAGRSSLAQADDVTTVLDSPADTNSRGVAMTVLATEPRWSAALLELPPEQRQSAMAWTADTVASVAAKHGGKPFEEAALPSSLWRFDSAQDAVSAAAAVRQALRSARAKDRGPTQHVASPAATPVNLDLAQGLHTVWLDVDGRLAQAGINQCRHICAVSNPGQILVAASTARLVGQALPDGQRLTPLGRHRLRDLFSAVELFDLGENDASVVPRRPISLDTLPNNLPGQFTSFVGRQDELREIVGLLGQHRLLTITGPGGGGKTRLAAHAAAVAAPQWPDGVWWVDLGTVEDSTRVLPAVASAAGLSLEPTVDLDGLSGRLRDRQMLIVLDTCEHLLESCAELATHVAQACPSVTILATSREPLGVPGEVRWIPRQQTLTASMQWSHNLLDAEERVFFRRLAVFPGTFDVEAAAAVCSEQRPGHQPGSSSDSPRSIEPSIDEALWRIGSLVDKSLIVARPVGGEVRYRLLDTVRQHAATQLAAAEETERCRNRHLDHYLAVAEAARLPLEMDQDEQRIRLAADRANLQAALD